MMDMENKVQEEEQASVPYFVHEGMMARMERTIRTLAILLIATLIIFVASAITTNVLWMKYVERERAEFASENIVIPNYEDMAGD